MTRAARLRGSGGEGGEGRGHVGTRRASHRVWRAQVEQCATGVTSVGDDIVMRMGDGDCADSMWAGCPGTTLSFHTGWTASVHRVQGAFFTTSDFTTLWAPLAAVEGYEERSAEARAEGARAAAMCATQYERCVLTESQLFHLFLAFLQDALAPSPSQDVRVGAESALRRMATHGSLCPETALECYCSSDLPRKLAAGAAAGDSPLELALDEVLKLARLLEGVDSLHATLQSAVRLLFTEQEAPAEKTRAQYLTQHRDGQLIELTVRSSSKRDEAKPLPIRVPSNVSVAELDQVIANEAAAVWAIESATGMRLVHRGKVLARPCPAPSFARLSQKFQPSCLTVRRMS